MTLLITLAVAAYTMGRLVFMTQLCYHGDTVMRRWLLQFSKNSMLLWALPLMVFAMAGNIGPFFIALVAMMANAAVMRWARLNSVTRSPRRQPAAA